MSEKIKAIKGNESRWKEVETWLANHGAVDKVNNPDNCKNEEMLFYVRPNGYIASISINYSELFDIEELPRWRAEGTELYYFISDTMDVLTSYDNRSALSNYRYDEGNYFRTEEAAVKCCEKIKKLLIDFRDGRGEFED